MTYLVNDEANLGSLGLKLLHLQLYSEALIQRCLQKCLHSPSKSSPRANKNWSMSEKYNPAKEGFIL